MWKSKTKMGNFYTRGVMYLYSVRGHNNKFREYTISGQNSTEDNGRSAERNRGAVSWDRRFQLCVKNNYMWLGKTLNTSGFMRSETQIFPI